MQEINKINALKTKKVFCTTRETAKILGVSVGTAQLWVDTGMLSAWKTEGGHRRVARESIDKLLHEKTDTPAVLPESSRLKVLVVEDSSNTRRLYEVVMAQWPMVPEVTMADSGIGAIMSMERQLPDLLILDLSMPDIDGFHLLKILFNEEYYARLTIVVVSGLDEAEISRRCVIPHGVVVLTKPVPFDKLLAIACAVESSKQTHVAGDAA